MRETQPPRVMVGVGAAAFMLVSTYGFNDVLGQAHNTLDLSR
ncbi:MAG: hypothetical protein ACTHQQ_20365 [Solirubrobacteraceae bacterium]